MSVPQKSLFFRPTGASRTTYRGHAPRAVGTVYYYLFMGPGGVFGSAISQANPARIQVVGRAFASAGSATLRLHFQYAKDAVRHATNGDITSGTWVALGVDRLVTVANLPSTGADDGYIIDQPMPYFEDLEGANALRLTATVGGAAFTAGAFDALIDVEPGVIRNAGHDTVLRDGASGALQFQNFNTGRIN